MYTLLLILYVFIAAFLITLIMLQQGKGADAGALGGTGASNTVFGSSGSATFLSRLTAIFATLFFIGALIIANINVHRNQINTDQQKLSLITQQANGDKAPSLPTDKPTIPSVPTLPK